MSVTVDVNVLVYASNRTDPAHEPAKALIEGLAAGPELLYLFWPCLLGYVRLVTHPAILPQPLDTADALGNVASLLELAHVRAPGEASGFLEAYQRVADANTRGNAVPGAHLAALMLQHGVATIYTRDRDFLRFEGLTVRDPFA